MRTKWLLIGVALLMTVLAIGAIACSDDDDDDDDNGNGDTPSATDTGDAGNGDASGSTLADVQDRGRLVCGVNDGVPGFGFLEADGSSSGFDVDFCRALAAAVLGDSEAVDYVILTAAARFDALAAGQIDVLIRNTTWTQSRDADLGGTFATTTFYDGQGMMVRAGEFTSIDEMDGTTICSLQGTTTELNLADRFAASDLDYTGLTYEENGPLEAAFTATECDGWTSDKSQLAARRFAYPEADGGPEALVILDEVFSKEPLGPVTRDGDSQWSDVVNWVVIGMITADEKGITSENVADFIAEPGEAETARLLGVGFEGGEVADLGLGIDPDFMQAVLAQVGNYDEVYTRNVEPLGIPRAGTVNASWLDGGLIYAPPTR